MTTHPPSQSADLSVSLAGIVIKSGEHEFTLSELAARQLLQALPALLKSFEEIKKVNPPSPPLQ